MSTKHTPSRGATAPTSERRVLLGTCPEGLHADDAFEHARLGAPQVSVLSLRVQPADLHADDAEIAVRDGLRALPLESLSDAEVAALSPRERAQLIDDEPLPERPASPPGLMRVAPRRRASGRSHAAA